MAPERQAERGRERTWIGSSAIPRPLVVCEQAAKGRELHEGDSEYGQKLPRSTASSAETLVALAWIVTKQREGQNE